MMHSDDGQLLPAVAPSESDRFVWLLAQGQSMQGDIQLDTDRHVHGNGVELK